MEITGWRWNPAHQRLMNHNESKIQTLRFYSLSHTKLKRKKWKKKKSRHISFKTWMFHFKTQYNMNLLSCICLLGVWGAFCLFVCFGCGCFFSQWIEEMIGDLTGRNNGGFQKIRKTYTTWPTQHLLMEESRRKHLQESWSKAIKKVYVLLQKDTLQHPV